MTTHDALDAMRDSSGPVQLLDEVAGFLRRYVGATPAQLDTCALWILHAWTISEWRLTPYLWITSVAPECGKSRLGDEAVGELVRRPLRAATATPAALIRSIDEQRTLIHDEIDGVFNRGKQDDPAAADLRTVFNAGHTRDLPALKCGPGNTVQEFPVFGPKVLIGIGDVLPEATSSRCLRIRLERLATDEEVEEWELEDAGRDELSARIRAGLEEHAERFVASGVLRDKLPREVFPVRDRARDNWRPLFTLAYAAGGSWPARVYAACVELSQQARDETYPIRVLQAAWEAIGDDERVSTAALILRMVEADDTGPWAGWIETDKHTGAAQVTRGGEMKLGRALGQFATPKHPLRSSRWRDGDKLERGWLRSELEPHAHRYAIAEVPRRNRSEQSEQAASRAESDVLKVGTPQAPGRNRSAHDLSPGAGCSDCTDCSDQTRPGVAAVAEWVEERIKTLVRAAENGRVTQREFAAAYAFIDAVDRRHSGGAR